MSFRVGHETVGRHFHLLRDFALEHSESSLKGVGRVAGDTRSKFGPLLDGVRREAAYSTFWHSWVSDALRVDPTLDGMR